MDWRKVVISRLFIAVPELSYDLDILRELHRLGFMSKKDYEKYLSLRANYRRLDRTVGKMQGKALVERLLIVAPQLISPNTVDLLRQLGLINITQGHQLRNLARFAGLFGPWNKMSTAHKMSRLVELGLSFDMIDMLESQGSLVKDQAQLLRGLLTSGRSLARTRDGLLKSKKAIDTAGILYSGLISNDLLRGLVLLGMIDSSTASKYRLFNKVAMRSWRVFKGARAAKGYEARLVIAITGAYHKDVLDAMVKFGILDKKYRAWLRLGESVATFVNDRMLEDLTKRRFRVVAGEPPIKTFLRTTRRTERQVLGLLAEAAAEAGKAADALDVSKVGGSVRAAQLRATKAALHESMRKSWEGVGYLTIFGEREAAMAAAESVDALAGKLLGKHLGQQARDSILAQSKAGVDAYISRQENIVQLSSAVYKNAALYSGRVDKVVNLALLQGKSAAELALDVERFINPNVSGGVKYAAMRLARTEMNNAFHLYTIRTTREMPWVKGYQWLRSNRGSRTDDACARYANDDGYGLGRGVFPKSQVPNKPHPNCLCYIIAVMMSDEEFSDAQKKGRFARYLSAMAA